MESGDVTDIAMRKRDCADLGVGVSSGTRGLHVMGITCIRDVFFMQQTACLPPMVTTAGDRSMGTCDHGMGGSYQPKRIPA